MSTSDPAPLGQPGSGGNSDSVRIGDADRNAAVDALGEHLTTGRLDLEEYGSRSAVANTARTVGEIRALFADLPAPHPMLPGDRPATVVPQSRPAAAVTNTGGGDVQATTDDRSRMQKLVGAAAAASGVIALILFLATGLWWWFLLIPLISSIAGSMWGEDKKRHRRHHGRR